MGLLGVSPLSSLPPHWRTGDFTAALPRTRRRRSAGSARALRQHVPAHRRGRCATGLGESFVAVANDPSAIYWNPAGLASLQRREVAFSHVDWPADIAYDHVTIAAVAEARRFARAAGRAAQHGHPGDHGTAALRHGPHVHVLRLPRRRRGTPVAGPTSCSSAPASSTRTKTSARTSAARRRARSVRRRLDLPRPRRQCASPPASRTSAPS